MTDDILPPETGFRGAHHPVGHAVMTAFAALAGRPCVAVEAPGPLPRALVDASPLAAGQGGVAILRQAVEALLAGAAPADPPGVVVFLLAGVDAPKAVVALRALARRAAPGWRVNGVRVGRSAEDCARTVAFALDCRSLTGQLVVLDPPYGSSVPHQPDLPPAAGIAAGPAVGPATGPAGRRTAGAGRRGAAGREVLIRDLVLPCRVGVRRHERDAPQRVRINLKLTVDETPLHDRLEDVVCYDDIVDHVRAVAAADHVNLVETLAERIADGCFGDPRVRRVRVAVEKLDIYPDAAAAGVRIVRERADSP
ncbi:MAG: dihydroneopterin aldolase [Alphaproteobacteria bacterium]